MSPKPLSTAIPNGDELLLDMIGQFLHLNPSKRLKANSALRHPFLQNRNSAESDWPPICPPLLGPSASVAQDVKESFLGSKGRRKEKPIHPIQVVKDMDPLHRHTAKDIATSDMSDMELPSIPLSPFAISADWSFGRKVSAARRLSLIQSDISPASPDNEDLDHSSTNTMCKSRGPGHLPALPRPSLSTPLLTHGPRPLNSPIPLATKSTTALSNLFGISEIKRNIDEDNNSNRKIPRS